MADVSICVLTYGDYPELACRSIESIRRHCPRPRYQLVVGGNAIGERTRAHLETIHMGGGIDELILSPVNLNQCPMMRRMFQKVESEFIWWFDDDSYITEPGALNHWLTAARGAPEHTVMWGPAAMCDHPLGFAPELDDVVGFVRRAAWYRGLPPPTWKLGGKGEFNFEGRGTGDGRWFFIVGGCWLMRAVAIRALDWPDRRLIKMGNDVFLGEAIRQHGWEIENIGSPGVAVNTEPRRGDPGWTPSQGDGESPVGDATV
jgi:hypothetical protein